jgi:hypothetical protein
MVLGADIQPAAASIEFTGQAPEFVSSVALEVGLATIEITGRTPFVQGDQEMVALPATGTLVITGYAPTAAIVSPIPPASRTITALGGGRTITALGGSRTIAAQPVGEAVAV